MAMLIEPQFERRIKGACGAQWPGDIEANRRWRVDLYKAVMEDKQAQAEVVAACKSDIQFWFGGFLWAYKPRHEQRVLPFVPYGKQRDMIERVHEAVVGGHDLIVSKCRAIGATWIVLGCYLHGWLFGQDDAYLVLSWKEDLVDKPGYKASLFWKLDHAVKFLPSWMRPRLRSKDRTHMHLGNPQTGCTIDGEATTAKAGRAGRCLSIFLDEAASMDMLEEVLASTADVSESRLFVSTFSGPNLFFDMYRSGKIPVVTYDWWQDPQKAQGLYRGDDGRLHSPWYDAECARRISKREIAQEIDRLPYGSGDMFFDEEGLQRAERDDVREPAFEGEIDWRFDYNENRMDVLGWADGAGKRRLKLWCPLNAYKEPPITDNYVIGADISNGEGASNTVLSVFAVNTGEKVAEFADPFTSPDDMAREAYALAKFFRGHIGQAFLIWEANGPGGVFGKELMRLGHHYVYFQKDEEAISARRSRRPGWHSSRRAKEAVLGLYRKAIDRAEFRNPCAEAIKEARDYIFMGNGDIGPTTMRDESTGARSRHGDRVIADALCFLGAKEQPRAPKPTPKAEYRSVAWMREKRVREKAAANPWNP